MGYENCGRRESYPYEVLADGKKHLIKASEGRLRALRYGAKRRGMHLVQHLVQHKVAGDGTYVIQFVRRSK